MAQFQPFDPAKTVFITGAAGFIGFHLARRLLSLGAAVVGLDNLNDYYDVSLKESRLAILEKEPKFTFVKGELADEACVEKIFADFRPDIVVNLAAQAGVRYSIDHPRSYIQSNIVGFFSTAFEPSVVNGIYHITCLAPAVGFVLLALSLAFLYPLDRKKVQENARILVEKENEAK